MNKLPLLFEKNRDWAKKMNAQDPGFFRKLSGQQAPEYLWIGCSDSRVPANEIVGLLPGELFVHRNVANVIVHTDLNCISVVQFAVELLKVKHIIVCGHYGCSGIGVVAQNKRVGLADNWLRNIHDVAQKHDGYLQSITDASARHARLCELNVIEQVVNICQTTVLQDAWGKGQELAVHGWIYGVHDGLLRDLNMLVTNPDEMSATYQTALESIKNT